MQELEISKVKLNLALVLFPQRFGYVYSDKFINSREDVSNNMIMIYNYNNIKSPGHKSRIFHL